MSAATRASAPTGGMSLNQSPMLHQIGARLGPFQLSFGKVAGGRERPPDRGYFTGTWSMCGQTAATSASSSGPPSFFGVSERQLVEISNGTEGL